MLDLTDATEVRCALCRTLLPPGATQCPKCGTKLQEVASAKASIEILAMASTRDLLKSEIPKTSLPDIRNTCPLCAQEIDQGLARCPRCGVPLRTKEGMAKPPIEKPAPSPVIELVPPALLAEEDKVEVAPPPVEMPPPPAPSKPSEHQEVSPGTVRTVPGDMRVDASGLINGRGATNGTGLINGRGATGGTGLVNGTGMINGTKPDDRFASISRQRATLHKRWQFIAILIAIVVVLPTFLYLSYARQSEMQVDGDFGEWAHTSKFGMQGPAALPEVSVEEWAVRSSSNLLYLYLKTASDVMGTSNVDSFFLFVDFDGNPDTGYSVSTLGADYMLEMHGWDRKVESASLMQFGSTSDSYNWTSWTEIDSVSVAISADRLEAKTELPADLTDDARFMLIAQDNMPDQASSVSYPVPAKGGALIITQEIGRAVNPYSGAIPLGSSVSLAELVLRCEGASGIVNSISPRIVGAGLTSPITDVSLSPGKSQTVEVLVLSSLTPEMSLVSAYVTKEGVSSTFADVVILGEPVSAYVLRPPTSIRIDGAFGDWMGRISPDNDSGPIANANVNMTGVGWVNDTSYLAFYVGVQGQIFQGACVPAIRGKPTSQGGGGGPVVPHRRTGEDVLSIYIDSDILNTTGKTIQRAGKVIGADYLLRIDGINGKVVSRSLMAFNSSGEWVAVSVDLPAAADSQRIETSVPSMYIGGATSFAAIIETTDWRDRGDWAWTGSVPDPWVVDAAGNAYMSSDGQTWSYLGTPILEPGDHIVDVNPTTDRSEVLLVTNTGRTYYWIVGTSTNWTAGITDPINTTLYGEAVSMSFYNKQGGAYLLAKNGSFFYSMKADTNQKPWAHYGYANKSDDPVTDFTDIMYSVDGQSMYAMRSAPNSRLYFSASGNSFTSNTTVTGSTSSQTDMFYIGGKQNTTDRLYVLCGNGEIRYSPNGGETWSAHGDLPTPTGSNTSKYVGIGIDSDGYMWVVTDTGYIYRSADTTTYDNFTFVGQSPIGGIVHIVPMPLIPEFPILGFPVSAVVLLFVVLPRIKRRKE